METIITAVRMKRRYLIHKLEIAAGTVYMPFEIKLPATIKKVTAIAFTNTANNVSGIVEKLGTIGLISNDETDLFLALDIYDDELATTDEELAAMSPFQPESNKPWDTGKSPKFIPVNIDGDSGVISGWFKAKAVDTGFTLHIYIEYEEMDELIKVCL